MMENQLQNLANRLLTRQKGLDNEISEIVALDELKGSSKRNEQRGPMQLDDLPAPLRKLYAKSEQDSSSNNNKTRLSGYKRVIFNEPLLSGFALLRSAQLLNIDVYYIGLESRSCQMSNGHTCWINGDDMEAMAGRNVSIVRNCSPIDRIEYDNNYNNTSNNNNNSYSSNCYRTILDDLASYNPLQKLIDRYEFLQVVSKLVKIFLSFMAIIIGFNEFLSTIVLCLMTIGANDSKFSNKNGQTNIINSQTNENSSMGLFVLVLVQFSSIYILFSTIFNGHLIWNLFSQRQFLVSKRFQYKTMLKLMIFIYLEYMINIAFVCNLYDWDFTSNNIESGSYSVLANLRILVTFKDFEHHYIDTFMTVVAFARGIIRISPYITINYAIICLKEHINTIRNQRLLTDSLKKRQKLRLVVGKTNRRRNESKAVGLLNGNRTIKKKVNFVTEPITNYPQQQQETNNRIGLNGNGDLSNGSPLTDANAAPSSPVATRRQTLGAVKLDQQLDSLPAEKLQNISSSSSAAASNQENNLPIGQPINSSIDEQQKQLLPNGGSREFNQQVVATTPTSGDEEKEKQEELENRKNSKDLFLERIEDFDELESYITNMYIFTGKLNRFMSSQGLTVFFIVHNLVISVSLIIPEAINGGVVMVQLIRLLLILIAILPFIIGQSLSSQLEQLSKQIDRIIIQQHFIHRRRDNLVRIRELIHDIKVNCGGMLNFNVATGIKYLVVAFASAFFIEQEHYKLTRRHKADDVTPTVGWIVGFPSLISSSGNHKP